MTVAFHALKTSIYVMYLKVSNGALDSVSRVPSVLFSPLQPGLQGHT